MMDLWKYARDRWEIYGDHFAPFTVRAEDRESALERAMERMAEVNVKTGRARGPR
jgi:hypothetical protein